MAHKYVASCVCIFFDYPWLPWAVVPVMGVELSAALLLYGHLSLLLVD